MFEVVPAKFRAETGSLPSKYGMRNGQGCKLELERRYFQSLHAHENTLNITEPH